MEVRILNQKENKVINRKEINFEIVYEKVPPKRAEALTAVAEAAKSDKNFTLIRKMVNAFGMRKLVGLAHSYPDKESFDKYEPKHIKKRYAAKEEKKEEAKPEAKEAAPAEKPAKAPKEKAEAPKKEAKKE